jgi:hypothetical protein
MKKLLRFSIALVCCAVSFVAFAQTINVKSADGATDVIYTNPNELQKAIDNATAGSTITLSGGIFNTSNAAISIAKEIHLIGAGFLTDSAMQTSRTYIGSGSLTLKAGSDNSTLEGFEIKSNIQVAENGSATLKNILINKVKVSGINCGSSNTISGSAGKIVSNLILSNSILGYIYCGYATQVQIYNNVFTNGLENLNGSAEITNNIFLGCYSYFGCYSPSRSISNTVIKNNIFKHGSSLSGSNNIESNNITTESSWSSSIYSTSTNNISNAVLTDIFQKYNEQNLDLDKLYLNDFHIKAGSAAAGAGTDGKDIGIYGGNGFRVKPSIPFIDLKEIGKQTNAQGQLPVTIRVKAQGNN